MFPERRKEKFYNFKDFSDLKKIGILYQTHSGNAGDYNPAKAHENVERKVLL